MKFEQINNESEKNEVIPEKLDSEQEILSCFTDEQRKLIKERQRKLSALAYFIGKDFEIPIVLGLPSNKCPSGWMWATKEDGSKFIQMNVFDLILKPMDYLRFVTSHEGGHARISCLDFIPPEIYNQKGFSFLLNAIEDPRDNNFVAENYPRFAEQMKLAYEQEEVSEKEAKEKARKNLGYQPRFMQAGFEYIKQWYRERMKQSVDISAELPDKVQAVVKKTLPSASDAWWRYPTKEEANRGQEGILSYAKVAYEIILEEIWPEFQKLVEQDLQDQKMVELLKDLQKEKQKGKEESTAPSPSSSEGGEGGEKSEKEEKGEGEEQNEERKEKSKESKGGDGLPKELKDKLSPEEQKELEKAIEKVLEEAKKEGEVQGVTKPIDLDSLSPGLKKKIQDYLGSLPEEKKKELMEKASRALKDFENEIGKELEGKFEKSPEEKEKKGQGESGENKAGLGGGGEMARGGEGKMWKNPINNEGLRRYQERLDREIKKDANLYEQTRTKLLPQIDKLEIELREILVAKKVKGWQGGFRTGKRIDIKKRIQEKAKSVPVMESHAWKRREIPDEKDYAISLLIDLTGSMMKDGKIAEEFKAVIVLAETLNRLSVGLEILGFNDCIYEYQSFGQPMSREIREHMGGIPGEAKDSCCSSCGNEHNETDLGWATETASDRLAKEKAEHKFLITLSDGKLEESSKHPRINYDMSKIIEKVLKETNIRLIGLGIGKDSDNMSNLYPNGVSNVEIPNLIKKLTDLIKDVIANSNNY